MSGYSVALSQLVQEFNLELVNQASDFDRVRVTVEDVNRPALPMVGFYEHFEPARLQMVGMVEFTYLNGLSPEQRFSAFDRFFAYKFRRWSSPGGCSPSLSASRPRGSTTSRCSPPPRPRPACSRP